MNNFIPTEPIGSIPRPQELIKAITTSAEKHTLDALTEKAIIETLREFEKTGSTIITDGEQVKASFVTYPLHGATNIQPDGLQIDFEDGHFRRLPLLTKGPFRYSNYAVQYLRHAQQLTKLSIKQAVISALPPSA